MDALCARIAAEMSTTNRTSIAVIEFSNLEGKPTELGRFLAEEVTTRLFHTRKFKVIERQMLNKVLQEQKFQHSGLIDEESARKLGRLLGVNAIVTGTLTDLASTIKINARMIGTETGEIFGAASAEIVKTKALEAMMGSRSRP